MAEIPNYEFYPKAHVLSGHLQRPVEQKIEKHAEIVLTEQDSHLTRFIEEVDIEGLVSFKSGQTRVSRSASLKNDPKNHGYVTTSTSVVEGLNVFEVVTAERVVAQVSTDYPADSGRKGKDGKPEPANYPHLTFLGTQFNNVQVNGGLLTLKLNLGMMGEREGDTSYLAHRGFLERAGAQAEKVAAGAGILPPDLQTEYRARVTAINNLIKGVREPKVTFSIVDNIDNLDAIPIPGVKVVGGHVLVIPHFGTVPLGEVDVSDVLHKAADGPEIKGNYFELTMFKINMGCVAAGTVTGPVVAANSHGGPPGT
jgi:hypothetical protein